MLAEGELIMRAKPSCVLMLMTGVTLAGVTCEVLMLVVETCCTTAGQQTGVEFC